MSDTAPSKITRLEELPREIPPPRDGWPALEARLRESGARTQGTPASAARAAAGAGGGQESADTAALGPSAAARPVLLRRSSARRSALWFAAVAAALVAVAAGIVADRLILQAGRADAGRQLAASRSPAARPSVQGEGTEVPASFVNDPRYLAERRALLASLDQRLKSLPPQTRQQVLASLATIHQSMQQIQQALGREPTNALLQGLLIDTYQDEMRVLTAVQEAGTASGES